MAIDIKQLITRGGYWRVIIRPTKDSYQKDRVSLNNLRGIIKQAQVRKRGWYYPHIDNEGFPAISQRSIGSQVEFEDHNEYWEFSTSGQFSHLFSMVEDYWVTPERAEKIKRRFHFHRDRSVSIEKFLEVVSTVYRFTEIYLFASNLSQFGDLKKINQWEIIVELHGVKNRMLFIEEFMRDLWSPYICQFESDEISFNNIFSREELIANSNQIALEKAVQTFEFFGWEEPNKKALLEDQNKLLEMRY
jgi:hypothetical protein